MQTESNTADSLSNTLFETLQQLKAGAIDIAKASAISEIARSITDIEKTKIAYMKQTKQALESKLFNVIQPDNHSVMIAKADPKQTQQSPNFDQLSLTFNSTKMIRTGTVEVAGNVTTHRMK